MVSYPQLSVELEHMLQIALGHNWKCFDPSTKNAINKYKNLTIWEEYVEGLGLKKEDAYPAEALYRQSRRRAPTPPRFQTFSQLQSFRENMSCFLSDGRWATPDAKNWILWIDMPLPVDLRYWTLEQRLELQEIWLDRFEEASGDYKGLARGSLLYLTFDQREAYGILTLEEIRTLDSDSLELYLSVFGFLGPDRKIHFKRTLEDEYQRNPMTYRNPKYEPNQWNYTGKLFED